VEIADGISDFIALRSHGFQQMILVMHVIANDISIGSI